jgi:imidazoleglycerol-phosphate dehydratase
MTGKNIRKALIERKTRETQISLGLVLEGQGKARMDSPVPFLNHMLELMTFHGSFDLELKAKGDIEVGFHHTVEDIGLCLGDAFSRCWGELKGIQRYGSSLLPMDEALVMIVVDISKRPHLTFDWKSSRVRVEGFDTALIKEFFQAVVNRAGLTLHVKVLSGENMHHIIEAIFKGFGRAVRQAGALQEGQSRIRSTKGIL